MSLSLWLREVKRLLVLVCHKVPLRQQLQQIRTTQKPLGRRDMFASAIEDKRRWISPHVQSGNELLVFFGVKFQRNKGDVDGLDHVVGRPAFAVHLAAIPAVVGGDVHDYRFSRFPCLLGSDCGIFFPLDARLATGRQRLIRLTDGGSVGQDEDAGDGADHEFSHGGLRCLSEINATLTLTHCISEKIRVRLREAVHTQRDSANR